MYSTVYITIHVVHQRQQQPPNRLLRGIAAASVAAAASAVLVAQSATDRSTYAKLPNLREPSGMCRCLKETGG
jgi:hypothetical protein